TSAVAAADPDGTVLLDTPAASPHLKRFLEQYQPTRVVAIGSFADDPVDRERRLGVTFASAGKWNSGNPDEWWDMLFPRAERCVVCPAQPRSLLIQAACLAGAVHAPLLIVGGQHGETADFTRRLAAWKTHEVWAVGNAAKWIAAIQDVKLIQLADEHSVTTAYLERQLARGPVESLLVANPADGQEAGGFARLAPWLALQRRAPLLLTTAKGDNTNAIVQAALREPKLRHADSILLLGDLHAIAMERRPNPVAGKDVDIAMEPL